MHRWLRVLVCLLLVSCILVNLSPLKAEATAGTVATAVTLAVGIPVAVAIGLQAVGVRQGSDSTAFNNVVSSAVDALSPEWAVNGLTTMLALTTDGVTRTFANQNFLQDLLDLFWGNNILEESDGFSTSTSCSYPGFTGIFEAEYPFAVGYYTRYGNPTFFVYSSYLQRVYTTSDVGSEGSFYLNSGPYGGYYVDSASNGSWKTSEFSGVPYLGEITPACTSSSTLTQLKYVLENLVGGTTSVTTSEDLTLESVGHDIETDYETYVETGIVGIDFGVQFEDDPNTDRNEEDDGNDLWLPVGIPGGSTSGSYIDQTQQDAQSGNTPQDVLDELLQNSGSGDGSGDGTGSDSGSGNGSGNIWKPPSDHNVFALADLSKFFPFCIPFDLYDFFTLLNAEPVAPVLSWEIKDLAGQTYSLDVDLSQWDSVALLFRRLQLFLFITGLAAASRKFIKW